MDTDREIALEQALVAVIAALETSGNDVKAILDKAGVFIIDSGSGYQTAGHPYGTLAAKEISDAHANVLSRKPEPKLRG
ncbi:hypothetical protein MNO08_09655 [Pseudomonas simiae]|uniref:hypothetical protein n=1 Tax=Pseudomonas simiae TaxID=321846 RepID=UPI001F530E71|nr:hypothetical protein [Pseudomonas simiae]UNK68330.1 hypothetical protein MNO08_09655 [Pseudomonas simiae]